MVNIKRGHWLAHGGGVALGIKSMARHKASLVTLAQMPLCLLVTSQLVARTRLSLPLSLPAASAHLGAVMLVNAGRKAHSSTRASFMPHAPLVAWHRTASLSSSALVGMLTLGELIVAPLCRLRMREQLCCINLIASVNEQHQSKSTGGRYGAYETV